MKYLATSTFLAIACATLFAPDADATLVYNDGDLILGVRASGGTGATIVYEVNLGSVTRFDAGGIFATGTPITLSLGNVGADLVATYGANWFNRSDVLWSISGVNKVANANYPNNTIFITKPEPSPGTQSTPWLRESVAAAGPVALRVHDMGVQFGVGTTIVNGGGLDHGDQVESTNVSTGLFQPITITNNYRTYMPGGSNSGLSSAFNFFVPGIEGDFTNGTAGSVLDFYSLRPASGNPPAPFLGSFQFDNAGNLTFVPEPAAAALLCLGAGLLGMTSRRRRSVFA